MPSEGFRKSGILAPEHRDNNVGTKWLLLMLSTASATGIAMCHLAVALEQQRESAYGYKQTSSRPKSTSAPPPEADIPRPALDFRF